MAKKIVKIGGKIVTDVLSVEIGGKTYSVPLAGSMKRKEIMALKDEDAVFAMFAKHIPEAILDDLTVNEYNQLAQAWIDANEEENQTGLGES